MRLMGNSSACPIRNGEVGIVVGEPPKGSVIESVRCAPEFILQSVRVQTDRTWIVEVLNDSGADIRVAVAFTVSP